MTAAVAGSAIGRRSSRPYLAPVPDTEPPFDPDRAAPTARPRRTQSRSAPSAFVRAGAPATVLAAPTSGACAAAAPWPAEPDIGVRRTATTRLPSARRSAQVLATALVEVLTGRRPVGQLRVHTAPGVFAALVNGAPRGWGTPAQVLSIRVCQPADGAAEASVTVRAARRAHAMAFRIDGVDGRWRITALDIG